MRSKTSPLTLVDVKEENKGKANLVYTDAGSGLTKEA